MRDGYRFEFGAFDKPDEPKVQALKPLEEAAEVFGAWQLHETAYAKARS